MITKKKNITVLTPLDHADDISYNATIFLAGSIEMDINGNATAEEWQTKTIAQIDAYFENAEKSDGIIDIAVFNPRREDWDNSWGQTSADDNFKSQVWWELEHLVLADVVLFYFDPKTKSPISMMELGLALSNTDTIVVVCCPDGFYKKGNIDVTCDFYGLETPIHTNLNEAIQEACKYLDEVER